MIKKTWGSFLLVAIIACIVSYTHTKNTSPLQYPQVSHTFSCANATIKIQLFSDTPNPAEYSKIILSATTPKKTIEFEFQNGIFAANCVSSNTGKDYILFQKYCSGSACIDNGNWGIIDPNTLKALILPSNNNFRSPKTINNTQYGHHSPLYDKNLQEAKKVLGYLPDPLVPYK